MHEDDMLSAVSLFKSGCFVSVLRRELEPVAGFLGDETSYAILDYI